MIILFDEQCSLCSECVRFVITRDRNARFAFASLQSEIGQRLKQDHGMAPEYMSTMVLIEDDRVLTRSEAALRIAWHVGGLWKMTVLVRVVPRVVRDWGYQVIARNRYRWFGKREVCWASHRAFASRFLTESDRHKEHTSSL